MSGETPFNSELCGAEHLMIEDDVASTDIRKRLHFGARIKEATVNEVQSLHAKRVPAISVKLFWRVSVPLNDEAEHLLILPPIDHSLADKIILLRARKRPMPMPTESQAERDSFWAAMLAELPAFTWFLTKWEIPKALRCARFGVTHYHHPVLLQAVEDLTPQTRLLELIDMHFWPTENPEDKIKVTRTPSLEITAVELEGMLLGGNMSREAHGVLTWPGAVGTYLGRLAGKYPKRIQSARGALRKWLIMPPGGGGR
jgi:hypothetical protein